MTTAPTANPTPAFFVVLMHPKPALATSQAFPTREAAAHYAASVSAEWHPVVACTDGVVSSRPAFLFHTMLEELVPGATWRDDHVTHTTSAQLQAEGHTATLEFVWPVHDTGWDLDCLTDDCRPMVNRVLDTFNRHVVSGHVQSVHCYMAPRKPATALSDPGWLEWGVYLRCEGGHSLYIAHIQRAIGADVERHT